MPLSVNHFAIGKATPIGNDPVITRLVNVVTVNYEGRLQCDTVCDAEECLQRINAIVYDLILTDTQTNGAEDVMLLRQIQQLRPAPKVIVLAAASTPADMIEAMLEHGVGPLFLKNHTGYDLT